MLPRNGAVARCQTNDFRATPYLATFVFALLVVCSAWASADEREIRPPHPEGFRKHLQPLLENYCADCHGEVDFEGDTVLANITDEQSITNNRIKWQKVLRQLELGSMPPQDYDPLPSAGERQAAVQWLNSKLHYVDCEVADLVGRVTIHRLNRVEYTNTIRDLLGIQTDVAEAFPSDDVGYGFSNIADVLSLPPLLLEKYVEAAEEVAAKTIYVEGNGQAARRFDADKLRPTGSARAGGGQIAMASTGGALANVDLEIGGQFILRVEARADQAGPDPARIQISIDGKPVTTHDTQGRGPRVYESEHALTAGRHRIEAAFTNDYYQPNADDPKLRGDRNLFVFYLELEGPTDAPPPKSHQHIIVRRPSQETSLEEAARECLGPLMARAFRRPVDDQEVDRHVQLVRYVVERGNTFERGIQVALQAILVSPHFLFRMELDPAEGESVREINDFELASRLSYFLWSSMPDETLFELARQGKLRERNVLDAQISRMLADDKADALVDNFASQWLTLSNFVESNPDPKMFPEFTPQLRADMVRETKLFIREIFRNDRSLLDFIDGDFTFVNERLADHYGFPGVKGDQFRRVSLPSEQRGGVLTHASLLTITSNPNRTSLVRRGAWVMDNILGAELPDPPPNVPSLEEGAKQSGAKTLREQLKIHRESPVCASCHDQLDPIGFGFENFDPIGRWREQAEGQPVDAGGKLPGGETFAGPRDLIEIIRQREDDFAKLVTKKMLTYALGRGLVLEDSCTVDEIVVDLKKKDYRFSALVRGIVYSKPFLMRSSSHE